MSDLKDLEELTKDSVSKVEIERIGKVEVKTASDFHGYINMAVYGDPGVGKTRLAGSAFDVPEMSPVLVVDVEGGQLTLRDCYPDVSVVRVKAWDDFSNIYRDLFTQLNKGTCKYKTVVIDNLSEMQKFNMQDIMNDLLAANPDRDPYVPSVREWGKNGEMIRRTIRGFRDLPCHTIFTLHRAVEMNDNGDIVRVYPSLSGKLANEISGFMDEVFFMYVKMVSKEQKRLLLTTATGKEVAKDRSDRLPTVVEEPTMALLYDYMFRNKSKEQ
jgi:hypothetical protein